MLAFLNRAALVGLREVAGHRFGAEWLIRTNLNIVLLVHLRLMIGVYLAHHWGLYGRILFTRRGIVRFHGAMSHLCFLGPRFDLLVQYNFFDNICSNINILIKLFRQYFLSLMLAFFDTEVGHFISFPAVISNRYHFEPSIELVIHTLLDVRLNDRLHWFQI